MAASAEFAVSTACVVLPWRAGKADSGQTEPTIGFCPGPGVTRLVSGFRFCCSPFRSRNMAEEKTGEKATVGKSAKAGLSAKTDVKAGGVESPTTIGSATCGAGAGRIK